MQYNSLVPNRIIPGCKVAIVTDTPSAQDVVKHELFTDKTAQILLGKLAACGIDYTQASLLSIAQDRHTKVEYMNGSERLAWTALLERELQKAQPNVIIAVGDIALRCLTYNSNVEKYRGTPCRCKLDVDAFVVPLEHHLNFFGSPAWKPLTDFYAQKIARYQHSSEFPALDVETIVTHDVELLEQEFLSAEFLADPESRIGFDIESSSAEMTCIGFAKSSTLAYVIPLVHMPMDKFVPLIRVIDKILRSPVRKIAQNGNFDLTYMGFKYHIKVENFWWDTMLAWHSVYPNLPKDLGTISSVCTDQEYWKDDGKQWMMPYDQVNWPQFFNYNGKDCANLLTIQETQEQLLSLRGTYATFEREMALCKPLIAMEMDGINIDQPVVELLRAETEDQIRRWQLFLDTLLGEELAFNVASPAQLATLLYTDLRLPKRVRKGKITTDEDALASLLILNPLVIKPIMILKKLKKEFSEYKVKINDDGKMRATFKPAGTMTGRLASSKSILDSGTNFQNRTKKIRIYFIPDTEDYLILNADYSKAESWIVAALAEDEKMLAALYGGDFHSENATNILGHHVDKSMYSDYQLGKRISHGANYRMTPFLLQKVLLKDGYTYTKTESAALMENYHMAYPSIRSTFHRRVEDQLKMDRTLTNCYGRKVTFWEHWNDQLLNSATAWEPQGTIGDMTNTALIKVYNTIPEAKIKIQVHDSLVMQVKKTDLCQDLVDRISACMLQELTINGITFTIPIDIEVGKNWLELDDWNDVRSQYGTY